MFGEVTDMKAIKFTKRIAELATELTEESHVYIKLNEREGAGRQTSL